MLKYFDTPSIIVIIATFVVFLVALFFKGLTHDILLEIGVLLVSVKLIFIGYQNNVKNCQILEELKEISKTLTKE